MAVYSEPHQYIFFANPQTASKAIALTLREKLQGKAMPDRELMRNGKTIARKHHTTYSQVLEAGLLTKPQLDALFKFTCVRNPFDQLVSKYLKHCDRMGNLPASYPWLAGATGALPENSFPQWLAQLSNHFTETDRLAKGPLEFLAHADLVIRFEALQEGFDQFLKHIGVSEPLSVIEHNVTASRADGSAGADATATADTAAAPVTKKRKKKYTEYYDRESITIVERLYEPILSRFGYGFAG